MLEQIASAINAERRLKRCRQHGGGGEKGGGCYEKLKVLEDKCIESGKGVRKKAPSKMELRKVKKARIEEAGWRVRVYVRQAWQGQEEAGCETPGPRSTTSPSVNDFLAPTSLILACY